MQTSIQLTFGFAGEIPWQMFHDLVQNHGLRQLSLGGNKFTVTTIPPIVATMTNLEVLSIYGLGFTGTRIGSHINPARIAPNRKIKDPKMKS